MPWLQPSRAASIWPVWLESSSIACLPRMTRPGLFGLDDALQNLGDAKRLDLLVDLDEDGAVGAHGERGAQRLLRLLRPDRHDHDLFDLAGFLQPDRLLDADFVERVHRHLDVRKLDARAVRLDADPHVRIDNPLHGNQHLH